MTQLKTFAVLGGDKRQLFLADSLLKSGCEVFLAGFSKLKKEGFSCLSDVDTALSFCDAVIFPLPSVRADKSLNTPFSDEKLFLSDRQLSLMIKKPLFVSQSERLKRAYPGLENARLYDYAARDDFAVLNAVPTAEGAIECAMKLYEGTISGSRVLITGFGRIGKILSQKLKALGAEVTVSARKYSDLAMIKALGFIAVETPSIKQARGYDIIFNTIPALIFDKGLLENTAESTLIIDLASLPGGVDFESASILGIDAVRALALPGKCAPKAAGEIIKNTIFQIIKEVNR